MIDLSRIEEYEKVSEGYTNHVYIIHDRTVLKRYSNYSAGSIFHLLREFLISQRVFSASDRINAEKVVRNLLNDRIDYPDIVDQQGNWLELEYVEGKSVRKLLEEEAIDPYEIGKRIGRLMTDFHESGAYLSDWSLDDIILTENGLTMIDFEFGGEIDRSFRISHDKISFFTQAATLDKKVYTALMDGFKSKVEISGLTKASGLIVALGFNAFYVWDDGKPVKVLQNILQEVAT